MKTGLQTFDQKTAGLGRSRNKFKRKILSAEFENEIRKRNSKNEIRKMKFEKWNSKNDIRFLHLQNSSEFIVAKQQIKIGWDDNELFQY